MPQISERLRIFESQAIRACSRAQAGLTVFNNEHRWVFPAALAFISFALLACDMSEVLRAFFNQGFQNPNTILSTTTPPPFITPWKPK